MHNRGLSVLLHTLKGEWIVQRLAFAFIVRLGCIADYGLAVPEIEASLHIRIQKAR